MMIVNSCFTKSFSRPAALPGRHRQNSLVHQRRFTKLHRPVRCQANQSPPDQNEQEPTEEERKAIKRKVELNLLLNLLVTYPGVRGTFAVLAGYFLHIDPLGSLHWSTTDAFFGLTWVALPILALDAAVILPKWEPEREERTIKFSVPKAVATKLTSTGDTLIVAPPDKEQGEKPDEELVEMERKISVKVQQSSFRDALYKIQLDKVMNNPGRLMSVPLELVLVLAVHVAEEMLYRGIFLTAAAQWLTDFIYTTTFDDTILLFNGQLELAIPQFGSIAAAFGMTTAAVALGVQSQLVTPQIEAIMAARKTMSGDKNDANSKKIENAVMQLQSGIQQQQRWSIGVSALGEFLSWSTACASFLITGNLLAPLLGQVAADGVYSLMQRLKVEEIKASRLKDTEALVARLANAKRMSNYIQDKKTARLFPPANQVGTKSGDDDAAPTNVVISPSSSASANEPDSNEASGSSPVAVAEKTEAQEHAQEEQAQDKVSAKEDGTSNESN